MPPPPEPRPSCARCRRPTTVCVCRALPQLPTRTRVLVLQHPRERRVGIGTARLAHLALPQSILRVGLDFANDPVVTATLATSASSYLLFPGPSARDVRELDPAQPITLVVVDGTWAQARTMVRLNPRLAALPRLGFAPARPSDYNRIRREPAEFCVSTIEAVSEVLRVLEPDGAGVEAMLAPFHAMVDRQERFAVEVRANRHRRGGERPAPSARQRLAGRLREAWPQLVCVQGEANGWPARHPQRQDPETVHFVAWRPATNERYEAVVAPRRALAPLTPHHIGLTAERLAAGVSVDEWQRSWRAFARPRDIVVQWGSFASNLAAAEGLLLPARRIDLRGELSYAALRAAGGTLDGGLAQLGAAEVRLGVDGRAGERLGKLAGLLAALARE